MNAILTDNTSSASASKACHRCGKSVVGTRRFRDQNGYWCVACSKADKVAYRANHLPCDDCGVDIKRGTELILEDHRLCEICHQKRLTEAVRQQMRVQKDSRIQADRKHRNRCLRHAVILAAEVVLAGVVLSYLFTYQGAVPTDQTALNPTTQPVPAAPAPAPAAMPISANIP